MVAHTRAILGPITICRCEGLIDTAVEHFSSPILPILGCLIHHIPFNLFSLRLRRPQAPEQYKYALDISRLRFFSHLDVSSAVHRCRNVGLLGAGARHLWYLRMEFSLSSSGLCRVGSLLIRRTSIHHRPGFISSGGAGSLGCG